MIIRSFPLPILADIRYLLYTGQWAIRQLDYVESEKHKN